MSATDLQEYVGTTADRIDFVTACWDEATALVDGYVGTAFVPATVLDRARLEVGAELFYRRGTKNGLSQVATPDAAPVRIARDPMVAAYPLLNRYVLGGFA